MAHPLRKQCKRSKGWRKPAGAVYVGRPTKWGNPFATCRDPGGGFMLYAISQGKTGVRIGGYETEADAKAAAVRMFRAYLDNDGSQPGAIRDDGGAFLLQLARDELRGKILLCWCGPTEHCHADVLAEIVNS